MAIDFSIYLQTASSPEDLRTRLSEHVRIRTDLERQLYGPRPKVLDAWTEEVWLTFGKVPRQGPTRQHLQQDFGIDPSVVVGLHPATTPSGIDEVFEIAVAFIQLDEGDLILVDLDMALLVERRCSQISVHSKLGSWSQRGLSVLRDEVGARFIGDEPREE